MTTLRLRAFHNDPGAMLSDDDIERALRLLPNFLEHLLKEGDTAKFTKQDYKDKQVEITITASCEKDELEAIIKHALKESKLVGQLI